MSQFVGVYATPEEADRVVERYRAAGIADVVAMVDPTSVRGPAADLVIVDELAAAEMTPVPEEFAMSGPLTSQTVTTTPAGLVVVADPPTAEERIEELVRGHIARAADRFEAEMEHRMFGPHPEEVEQEQELDLDGRPVRPRRAPHFRGLGDLPEPGIDVVAQTWAHLRAGLADAIFSAFGPMGPSGRWGRWGRWGRTCGAASTASMGQRHVDGQGHVWRSARDGEGGFCWEPQVRRVGGAPLGMRRFTPDSHIQRWDDDVAEAADDFDAMLADIGAARESLKGRRE